MNSMEITAVTMKTPHNHSPIFYVAMLFCLTAILPASAQELRLETAKISIVGHGEVQASPDLALISIGVITQGKSARDSAQANSRAMTEAVNALKMAGIEAKDLQTSGFSLRPLYTVKNNSGTPPKISGFQTANTLTVTIRNLSKLGDILERAIELGANNVSGPDFQLSMPEAKRNEARKAAMADALARAKLYADGLGFRLGRVLAVGEANASNATSHFRAKAVAPVLTAASPPIEAGESTITASLSVVWEILPAQ